MDGIKPTPPSTPPASAPNDQNLASTPVMVDLLHPTESTVTPDAPAPDMKLPEPHQPTAVDSTSAPAPSAAPSAAPTDHPTPPEPAIAPITPPLHAVPEPTSEMVDVTPPVAAAATPTLDALKSTPSTADLTPPPPSPSQTPAPAFAMPPEDPKSPVAASGPVKPPRRSGRVWLIVVAVVLLLAAVGYGVYYFFFRPAAEQAPAPATVQVTAVDPTNLAQVGSNGALSAGATTSTAPNFQMVMPTSANTGTVTPQVEVEPAGTPFSGTPSQSGAAVTATGSNLTLSVSVSHLDDGSYHWQARTMVGNTASQWVSFSPASASGPDFTIKAGGPKAPSVTGVTGGSVNGSTINLTQNQPTFTGKTDPGTTMSLSIAPDSITLAPTVASDGSWSVAASSALPNGNHTLVVTATDASGNKNQTTYALTVNTTQASSSTSTDASGTGDASSGQPSTTAATSPSATPSAAASQLASTGDNTAPLSLLGLVLVVLAATGLIWTRRLRID